MIKINIYQIAKSSNDEFNKIIEDLKQKYALCFGYVNTEINTANSLEELFDAIIKKHISSLQELLKKY